MRLKLLAAASVLTLCATPALAREEGMWTYDNFPIARVNQTYGAHIDQAWLDALDAESEALGVRIREGCLELPNPVLEDYWDRVYAQTPPGLVAQPEAYLAYEASFEGDQA